MDFDPRPYMPCLLRLVWHFASVSRPASIRLPAQLRPSSDPADSSLVVLSVDFEWSDAGEVRLNGGALQFPQVPASPGVYCFRLISASGERHYVGETSLLPRRFQNYRTPGPTQRTNLRLNALLKEVLPEGGGRVEVAVVTGATLTLEGGEAVDADLSDRAVRLVIENAALVAARHAGTSLENQRI